MSAKADLSMANAYVPGQGSVSPETDERILRRQRLLGPAYRLMYETPLHLVRGEGVWLYDETGRPYMDAYNNVTSLGHCHPGVVKAIRAQVGVLATNTRYLHETILDYAERLLATFPPALGHVMFACTGSEANDLALRIARSFTGGTGIVVTETAYHGITQSVAEFSPSLGPSVDLGAHVRLVPAPDLYRSGGEDVGAVFEGHVRAAIADLKRHGIRPAVLIVDTLFTSDGVLADPAGFLAGAVAAVREAGGLFVADEVQPGFARTGSHFWGFERHGVEPDMVTLGKPMGNGQPISGVVMRPEIVEQFGRNARYFNTFGGNAVSCAAAMAVLRAIQEEGLQENAARVGERLLAGLGALARRHEQVGDVRGAGLFAGFEIVSDRSARTPDRAETTRVVNRMREEGILISLCAKGHNVLKIRPPLVFTDENADLFVETLDRVLGGR